MTTPYRSTCQKQSHLTDELVTHVDKSTDHFPTMSTAHIWHAQCGNPQKSVSIVGMCELSRWRVDFCVGKLAHWWDGISVSWLRTQQFTSSTLTTGMHAISALHCYTLKQLTTKSFFKQARFQFLFKNVWRRWTQILCRSLFQATGPQYEKARLRI